MNLPFHLSPAAIAELRQLLNSGKVPAGYLVRVAVKGAGCSGVSYAIGFDTLTSADLVYQHEDIKFLVAKKDLMHLFDIEIDYKDTYYERGFDIHPGAKPAQA